MKLSEFKLSDMLSFKPESGQILLGNDRMLLFRQEAFLVLRKLMYEQLGKSVARSLLSQFGFRCGVGDYQTLTSTYQFDTEMDKIASGPMMHSWEGIVLAEPTLLEFDRSTGHFHMKGTWKNSYEAELHLKEFGREDEPVCHSLSGYASGWCQTFFGQDLLAVETSCLGKGDDCCSFEIRPPDKWGSEADPWRDSLAATSSSIVRELEEKLVTIEKQREAIRELSTPILEVWDDVLVLPIVGVMDTRRSVEVMDTLLSSIVSNQAKCVIIDITGVQIVDTKTADYLLKVVHAAQLLGARCVLTGINPAVAQTLVEIGADLSAVNTLRNLKAGLFDCIRFLEQGKSSGKG